MVLIFIDIDGTFINNEFRCKLYYENNKPISGSEHPLNDQAVVNLKYLIERYDASIVVSSTYRKHEKDYNNLILEFAKYDLDNKVIGKTPILDDDSTRLDEIKQYFKDISNKETIDAFVVLDDDPLDNGEFAENYLVKCNYFKEAFEHESKLVRAIEILDKQLNINNEIE